MLGYSGKGLKSFFIPDDEGKRGIEALREMSGGEKREGVMDSGKKILISTLLLAATVYLSCGGSDTVPGPGNQANDHISITNDEAALASRLFVTSEEIFVDETGVGYASGMGAPARPAAAPFSLTLTAEVLPPPIGGKVLQATSIAMSGNKAVVSYAMRGAEYLGGIDVFLISNEKNVSLKSEALFNNADVNSVTFSDGNVYAAEATGDGSFAYPAICEVLGLQGTKLVLDGNQRAPLTSYAGTSAVFRGGRVYTTSGDNGALSVFDSATLALRDSFGLHDARWVDVNDGKVVVAQGTPGRISVYDEANMTLPPAVFPFHGANVPESKSTVQVTGGKALIAAGDNGVQVVSLATGNVLGHVPLPDHSALGLSPEVVVTNAVSAEGDLLFISNGEAGVYVARAAAPFDQDWGETYHAITVLGKLRFSNLQSVNHVAYKDGLLIVASGLGGLKVVRLSH